MTNIVCCGPQMVRTPAGTMSMLITRLRATESILQISRNKVNQHCDKTEVLFFDAKQLLSKDPDDPTGLEKIRLCFHHYLKYLEASSACSIAAERCQEYSDTIRTMNEVSSRTGRRVVLSMRSMKKLQMQDEMELVRLVRSDVGSGVPGPEEDLEEDEEPTNNRIPTEPQRRARRHGCFEFKDAAEVFSYLFGEPDRQTLEKLKHEKLKKEASSPKQTAAKKALDKMVAKVTPEKKGKAKEKRPWYQSDERYKNILANAKTMGAFPYNLMRIGKKPTKLPKGSAKREHDIAMLYEFEYDREKKELNAKK